MLLFDVARAVGDVISGRPVVVGSDTPGSAVIIAASITALVAAIAATLAFIGSRRGSTDSKQIGLINANQATLEGLANAQGAELRRANEKLEQAYAKIDRQEARIAHLEQEVVTIRVNLTEALQHHTDCEAARAGDAAVIAELRTAINELRALLNLGEST
jgi:chromosome segregation ATPase